LTDDAALVGPGRADPAAFYKQLYTHLRQHPEEEVTLECTIKQVLKLTGWGESLDRKRMNSKGIKRLTIELKSVQQQQQQQLPLIRPCIKVVCSGVPQQQPTSAGGNSAAKELVLEDGDTVVWQLGDGSAGCTGAADPELLVWRPNCLQQCRGVIVGRDTNSVLSKVWLAIAALMLWRYHVPYPQQPSSLQQLPAWQQLCQAVPVPAPVQLSTGITDAAAGLCMSS
jgi:hypothetical protein